MTIGRSRSAAEIFPRGRLAGIRITHQRGIGHRPKLEEEVTLLTLFAFRVLDRSAIPRTLEMNVTLPAVTALTKNKLFTVVGEICDWIRGLVLLKGRHAACRE